MPNISRRRTRQLAAGVGDEYIVQWGDEQDLRSQVYPVNDTYLQFFEDDMRADAVAESAIRKHLANADTYLNQYLLERENLQMPDGVSEFFGFMSHVYTKKTADVNPTTVKAMCLSVQKFYHSMLSHDRVRPLDYEELCQTIKENQTEWMAATTRFSFG